MTSTDFFDRSRLGDDPADGLDCLRHLLRTCTLSPMFEPEAFGNFIITEDAVLAPGEVRFWGNFWDRSFVFQVTTTDPALIAELTDLIRTNQATPAYAQARQEEADRLAYWHRREIAQQAAREAQRRREAQAFLGLPQEG